MDGVPFWFQLTTVFALGACVGSFLNVCIYRSPRGQSIITPRSRCPHCSHPLTWWQNIPLFSFLLLKGKCHYCREPISPRYFLVEMLTAALFLALYIYSLPFPHSLFYFAALTLFVSGLVVATFIDFEFYIIPDTVSLGGIPLGWLASFALPFMMGQSTRLGALGWSFFSTLFGAALLLLISFLGKKMSKKEAMGMGDVKFMAMIGAFLGIKKVLLTLIFGSLLGSIVGIALIVKARAGFKSQIPFGPYLAAGALAALFFGEGLWNWYFSFE